ncbi:hypothetical protein [Burkholderia sp. MSMB1826]|nr:hypothetical protein [Burkholderia sp. MSMB1826]
MSDDDTYCESKLGAIRETDDLNGEWAIHHRAALLAQLRQQASRDPLSV